MVKITCKNCSKIFNVYPSRLKGINTPKYCSNHCKGYGNLVHQWIKEKIKKSLKKGKEHPQWKGGRIIRNGYVLIRKPSHPSAIMGGYIAEHRLVMENFLKRLLKKNEIIHHINGRKDDNRIENLEIISQKTHVYKHHTIEDIKKMGEKGRKSYIKNHPPSFTICGYCKKSFRIKKYRIRNAKNNFCCKKCFDKWYIKDKRPNWKNYPFNFNCKWCNKIFSDKKHHFSKFCSFTCAAKFREKNKNK